MTFHIRSGHHKDVGPCVKILTDWVDELTWAGEDDDHDTIVAIWTRIFATEHVWVAENQGHIIGFCSRGNDNISGLHVTQEARNQGLGKCLLDHAKKDRSWITVWAYELNVDALRFYKREGLVEVSREVEEGSNLIDIEHRWIRPAA